MERHFYTSIPSPVGELRLVSDGEALVSIDFEPLAQPLIPSWVRDPTPFTLAATQLAEYFAGHRRNFELLLRPHGTAFQLEVWQALAQIPYGETRSYAELARAIGRPKAQRAVGGANGKNPLPIVVPCHRVIAAGGGLGGYSSGVERKQQLLELERL